MNATVAIPTRAEVDRILRATRRRFPGFRVKRLRLLRGQPVFSVRCAEGECIVYFRGGWVVAPGGGFSLFDAEAIRTVLEGN